jgi:hypothetical protein
MKRVATNRFAIMKKGGQYVKPFIDDSPYLLFKTKTEAERSCLMDLKSTYKVVKVRVIIEPIEGCI